jgi:hypothetical protein
LAFSLFFHSLGSYEYENIELPVPKKFHEPIEDFFEQDLTARITVENDVIFIDLTPNQKSKDKDTQRSPFKN